MKSPKAGISVVIPVFNCERYIGAAIESVLKQTVVPDEIIVVDDGSTDSTVNIVSAYSSPVRMIRQQNRGGAAATNSGVAAASGSFLCFLDADDLWLPHKVSYQLEQLSTQPILDAVFGYIRQFISDDVPADIARRLSCPPNPQPGISKVTMMIRRAAFENVGIFDPTLRNIDFLEWYTRAIDKGIRLDVPMEVVALRRLHATNFGSTRREDQRSDNLEALKRALDRRRSALGQLR